MIKSKKQKAINILNTDIWGFIISKKIITQSPALVKKKLQKGFKNINLIELHAFLIRKYTSSIKKKTYRTKRLVTYNSSRIWNLFKKFYIYKYYDNSYKYKKKTFKKNKYFKHKFKLKKKYTYTEVIKLLDKKHNNKYKKINLFKKKKRKENKKKQKILKFLKKKTFYTNKRYNLKSYIWAIKSKKIIIYEKLKNIKIKNWFIQTKTEWNWKIIKLLWNVKKNYTSYISFKRKDLIIINNKLQIIKWPMNSFISLKNYEFKKKSYNKNFTFLKHKKRILGQSFFAKYFFKTKKIKMTKKKYQHKKKEERKIIRDKFSEIFFSTDISKYKKYKNKNTLKDRWFLKLIFFKNFYFLKNKKIIKNIFQNYQKNKKLNLRSFLLNLESQINIFLYRTNLFNSLYFIKQLVTHGYIYLDGKKILNKNAKTKLNKIITIGAKSQKQKRRWFFSIILNKMYFNNILLNYPKYLEINYKLLKGTFIRKPYEHELYYLNNIENSFKNNFFF